MSLRMKIVIEPTAASLVPNDVGLHTSRVASDDCRVCAGSFREKRGRTGGTVEALRYI